MAISLISNGVLTILVPAPKPEKNLPVANAFLELASVSISDPTRKNETLTKLALRRPKASLRRLEIEEPSKPPIERIDVTRPISASLSSIHCLYPCWPNQVSS